MKNAPNAVYLKDAGLTTNSAEGQPRAPHIAIVVWKDATKFITLTVTSENVDKKKGVHPAAKKLYEDASQYDIVLPDGKPLTGYFVLIMHEEKAENKKEVSCPTMTYTNLSADLLLP